MRPSHVISVVMPCVLLAACWISCAYSSKTKSKSMIIQVMEQSQIMDIGIRPHKEYVVRNTIDLQGKQVNVPEDVAITFKKGGSIVNGTLNGNGTKLVSYVDEVLGVKLKGTWRVDKISDLVFSKEYLSDTEIIDNINTIQSDTITNEVVINRDYHITIAKSGGTGIHPSSHSTILLKGTISLKGNNYKAYQIIEINNKKDVSIKGGRIVGDVGKHTYIEGTTSEWGMGVKIDQSQDVSLSDIHITKCTGDGIYISGGREPSVGFYGNASKNITIKNITCDDNRRQGLSIIHVDGLVVRDCSFINSGNTEYTAPGSGIDIEPNVSNNRNMSVRNVVVDNCLIENNKGSAIATNNTYEIDGRVNYESILFSNCKTDGPLKAQSHDVTFRKCFFKEVQIASVYAPTHITFEECRISGGYGIIIYVPSQRGVRSKDRLLALDFKGCTISTIAEETRTKALISCYKSYVPNLKYVFFENCVFTIPPEKASGYSLTDYSFDGKLIISKSVLDLQGRSFDASGMILNNNKIRCRGAFQLKPGTSNRVIVDN